MAEEEATADESRLNELATRTVQQIVKFGLDGKGPIKGAEEVAREHASTTPDIDTAISRLIRTHTRNVAATGFASGFGGIFVAGVMIPADITALYVQGARLAGGIAALRGYDLRSEEVRSVVLLSLIGSAGASVVSRMGVNIGNRSAIAALRRLPGHLLTRINKAVGFRLVTKFGTKGAINLGKLVPVVGGGVSAAVNVATMRTIGIWAKRNFPPVTVGTDATSDADEPIEAEVISGD